MKPIVIYHGNCADGFGAAWAAWKRHGDDFEYFPGVYQNPPPDVTGRSVYLLDFSYKLPIFEKMIQMANDITILDHHKTAQEDILPLLESGKVKGVFDLKQSGAMLAWQFFHPGKESPKLIRHIQDRDLWRFEFEETREIQACLFSYPYDFAVWDRLMNDDYLNAMRLDGIAIERKHFKDIDELLKITQREMTIGGFRVPVANLPYTLTSDAGHKMAQGKPFAACYWDTPEGRAFSLRSTDDGIDVSEIAKQYGGGGHKNASGFRVNYGHELTK